jgi:iron complex transport system substrate-binding protein
VLFSSFFAGCKLQNDDPKAMREWKARYGDNASASKILNSMPRDDLGRVVELRKIPQRLVVIGPGAVESLFKLGLGQKIVGRDSYLSYPPEIADKVEKIPVAGDYKGPNAEQTLALNPDLVVITGETYGRERVDLWQKQIGVPVACLAATTLGGVANGMQKLAKWTDTKPPADFANDMANIAKNSNQNSATTNASAMVEVARSPFWAAGSDTLVGDVLRAAGFQNAAKIQGYKQLNLENLLTQQPQFYVVTSSNLKTAADIKTKLAAERQRVLVELRKTPGVKGLRAVQDGRILIVPADWALRPGPRLGLAVAALREQKKFFETTSSTR